VKCICEAQKEKLAFSCARWKCLIMFYALFSSAYQR
jgi:hypothetical protein